MPKHRTSSLAGQEIRIFFLSSWQISQLNKLLHASIKTTLFWQNKESITTQKPFALSFSNYFLLNWETIKLLLGHKSNGNWPFGRRKTHNCSSNSATNNDMKVFNGHFHMSVITKERSWISQQPEECNFHNWTKNLSLN